VSSPVNGGARQARDERSEDDVAQPVTEQGPQAWARDAFQAPDHAHQRAEEALLPGTGEVEPAPALWEPDLVATRDELYREQHRDDLEDMRGAAGRQRERGHTEEQDEQQREALRTEALGQAAEGRLAVSAEPVLEVATDAWRS
jgi:hypothetical protein